MQLADSRKSIIDRVIRPKDLWTIGVVVRAVEDVIEGNYTDEDVRWIDVKLPAYGYFADPFVFKRGDKYHILAEHFDYYNRKGRIYEIILDNHLAVVDFQCCLEEPWHLSYPFHFKNAGDDFMLPEAVKSGSLKLYRFDPHNDKWQGECNIVLDSVPIDPTIMQYNGLWWMFYSPATNSFTRSAHLHIAWATQPTGPWTSHPLNPVRVDIASSRPGGRPALLGGRLMLPVQDCSQTYGGGIRPLWIDVLNEREFVASAGAVLRRPILNGKSPDGMHTLSFSDSFSLIDVKSINQSISGFCLDVTWLFRRYSNGSS